MTSERKTAANRANAQRSTGPRSKDGKRRAAKNALRHGLSARHAASADPRVTELAAELGSEDPRLAGAAARRLADAMVTQATVARVTDELVTAAMAGLDPELPYEVREDLARLEVLPRLAALADYDRRAAAAIRKQLRKL